MDGFEFKPKYKPISTTYLVILNTYLKVLFTVSAVFKLKLELQFSSFKLLFWDCLSLLPLVHLATNLQAKSLPGLSIFKINADNDKILQTN